MIFLVIIWFIKGEKLSKSAIKSLWKLATDFLNRCEHFLAGALFFCRIVLNKPG